jgi:hypothetical protein
MCTSFTRYWYCLAAGLQEFCLHTAEICVVKAHHQGRFILTADSAGTWMIHALLPPVQYEAHAAAFMGHSPRV